MTPPLNNIPWKCYSKFHILYKINPSRPDPGRREKINLNFYFHTSLWCLKRFCEGLKGLYKTFWDTTKKCENKNLSLIFILIQLSEMNGAGRVKRDNIMVNRPKTGPGRTWNIKRFWLSFTGWSPLQT